MMLDHHTIRVLVADRQALFRGAIAAAVSDIEDIEVVGSTGSAPQSLGELARLLPDVALVDMDLPGGAERVIRWTRKNVMTCRILAVAEREDENSIVEILEAGASGYLSRKCNEEELIEAVRATSRNDFVMPPGMFSTLLRKLTVGAKEDDLRIERSDEIVLDPERPRVISLDERVPRSG